MKDFKIFQHQDEYALLKLIKRYHIYFIVITNLFLWVMGFYQIAFLILLVVSIYVCTRFYSPVSFDHGFVLLIKTIILCPLILTIAFYMIMVMYKVEIIFLKQALIYFLIAIEYLFAFFLSHIFTGLSTTLVDLTSIWEYQNFSENVINHYLQPRFKLFILFVFLMGLYVLNKLFRFSFNEKGVFFKSIQKGNRNISRKKIYIQVCFCGFIIPQEH